MHYLLAILLMLFASCDLEDLLDVDVDAGNEKESTGACVDNFEGTCYQETEDLCEFIDDTYIGGDCSDLTTGACLDLTFQQCRDDVVDGYCGETYAAENACSDIFGACVGYDFVSDQDTCQDNIHITACPFGDDFYFDEACFEHGF